MVYHRQYWKAKFVRTLIKKQKTNGMTVVHKVICGFIQDNMFAVTDQTKILIIIIVFNH